MKSLNRSVVSLLVMGTGCVGVTDLEKKSGGDDEIAQASSGDDDGSESSESGAGDSSGSEESDESGEVEPGNPEVRQPLWDGESEGTIRLSVVAFDAHDYDFELSLSDSTISGTHSEWIDGCNVTATLEPTVTDDAVLYDALAAAELVKLSTVACQAAKVDDDTSFDGSFPVVEHSEHGRYDTYPGSCRIPVSGMPNFYVAFEDAFFAAGPTITECPED